MGKKVLFEHKSLAACVKRLHFLIYLLQFISATSVFFLAVPPLSRVGSFFLVVYTWMIDAVL